MSLLKPGLGSSHTPRVSPVRGPVLWVALESLAAGDKHREVGLLPGSSRARARPVAVAAPSCPWWNSDASDTLVSVSMLTPDTDPEPGAGQPRMNWDCRPWGPHRREGLRPRAGPCCLCCTH